MLDLVEALEVVTVSSLDFPMLENIVSEVFILGLRQQCMYELNI